ncbi:MAG: tyrosine-type recombinase/integrase [Nocardioides sp.]|nr:tyrosine-type recombinase/integrase [Nocardioides sp.]
MQHRGEHPTHQFARVGGLEHVDELKQGRLVQGHRGEAFREFLGRFSQSLPRWPAYVPDRHDPTAVSGPELHHSKGLSPANVRRQLRKVLGDAGIEGVTPHMFRRTVATVINEQASLNLASELLGHTDPRVTIEHYVRRNEQVNPLTAELLDAAFAREDEGTTS